MAMTPGLPLPLLNKLCICILLTCTSFVGVCKAAPYQDAPAAPPKTDRADEKKAPLKSNKILTAADFREAFRGVWAPPSGPLRKSFSGSDNRQGGKCGGGNLGELAATLGYTSETPRNQPAKLRIGYNPTSDAARTH